VIEMRRTATLLAVAALMVGVAVPAASAKATHTEFHGLYFPAGMEGTGSECPDPYVWQPPAFCVIDPGRQIPLPSGRIRIRNMQVYELAFAWNDDGSVQPRKTGYDIVTANANMDATMSGPTWGTWELHAFDGTLMFTGTFTGKFKEGIPAVHFVGEGVGIYEGEKMRGDIGRVPDPFNMFGEVLAPGSS
jgi:hypothetical protein